MSGVNIIKTRGSRLIIIREALLKWKHLFTFQTLHFRSQISKADSCRLQNGQRQKVRISKQSGEIISDELYTEVKRALQSKCHASTHGRVQVQVHHAGTKTV